jgi:hypothetical protein
MMADYCLSRWDMFLRTIGDDLAAGKPTDFRALDERTKDFEWQWAQTAGGEFRTKPEGDVYTKSRALFDKYAEIVRPNHK